MKRVSKQTPCPVCQRPDWCGLSDDGDLAVCMRVQSAYPSRNGGWLHILKEKEQRRRPRRITLTSAKSVEAIAADLTARRHEWQADARCGGWLRLLSETLGLSSSEPLRRLGVGFNRDECCWTWPLRDPAGRIVGVNRRFRDGTKKMMRGTHAGLYLPDGLPANPSLLLIAEGGSDAAAGLDLGFPTVGRFACTGQHGETCTLLRILKPGGVAIVADDDGPGRAGAIHLAGALRPLVPSLKIIEPPSGFKDLRDWRRAGATTDAATRLIDETPEWPLRLEVITRGRG